VRGLRLRRLQLRRLLLRQLQLRLKPVMHDIGLVILVGLGATAVMDAWLLMAARLGMPTTNWALVGRWVGHMPQGRFAHASMARTPAIRGELAIGWLAHYAIGIGYAVAFIALVGTGWTRQPTLLPAALFGLVTVAAPLLVMQPAMGSGFAASRTATPLKTCLRSLANHGVFGLGLYLTAAAIAPFLRLPQA